ncbi:VOC family protein [Reichenbachiella agarivorans]|uniref:VOC family protein n=1 Tax=Reichenbachiella agarivorans TaxID=2979464 RepID=A0ABY6CL55_9BACT|nr:VOC family protein [Reichenbachiella agarivorans]UXP31248.1 VOC family protein [Reichenbachiella agarivorans]
MKNPIYPCLWFDGNAKEAADLYCSIFPHARVTADTPMVVNFEMSGQKFMGLNGGSMFKINPSISFFVVCESIDEIDLAWQQLSKGGNVLMPLDKYDWSEKYGWIQDKFGVNWQLSYGKLSEVGQKFTPTLMFVGEQHGKTIDAIDFYTAIFEPSSIRGVLRYSEADQEPTGTVKHAQFTLDKTVLMAMDSSYEHDFQFSEGLSFVIDCETQEEIDYYWQRLTEGGQESQCGWLKDPFGVSWQVVPTVLESLMSDPVKAPKVTAAFLKMSKFDIETLIKASES